MKDIATNDKPIRASMLPYLFACPKMFMARFGSDGEIDDVAANTGSLAHAGIEQYHVAKRNLQAGLRAIDAATVKYPAGDVVEAKALLIRYVERDKSDPRGEVTHTEQQIKITIPCAAHDKTKKPIVIWGTLDQIRKVGDEFWVVDHKSGRRYADTMKRYYAPQLAAYMLGAAELLKTTLPIVGYITRLQDLKRSDLAFWHKLDFGVDDCLNVLLPVRNRIASIRAGLYEATPHDGCEWCQHRQYPNCITGVPIIEKPVANRNINKPESIPLTVHQLFNKQ